MHPNIREPAFDRQPIKANPGKMINPVLDDYFNRLESFKLVGFQPSDACTAAYTHWWAIMAPLYFSVTMDDCLSRLDPEYKFQEGMLLNR